MYAASKWGRSSTVIALALACVVQAQAQRGDRYSAIDSQRSSPSSPLVTLDLRDATLGDALAAVTEQGGISLVYSSNVVPLQRRVTVSVRAVPVMTALRAVLQATDIEARELAPGQITLVRRPERPTTSPAEEGVLHGRIVDSATGAPVPRATVSVDISARRVMTNESGEYRFVALPTGAHLIRVQRIGYAPVDRSIVIPDRTDVTLDIVLSPVASRLQEVVTTVTGAQRRVEVGNAIAAINADSVVRGAPITSLADLINARVSGAQVVMNGGFTGTSPRIRIRGLSSLTVNNDPLLIVDGARVDNSTGGLGGYGQTAGRFNDLSPEEIESIEIVKGPSAATLYGTNAANGVIVVRTKRGVPGRMVRHAFVEGGLVEEPARFPDNFYAWGTNAATGAAQQCLLTQRAAGVCRQDSVTTFNPLMNRETSPLGTGNRQQVGLQLSGGAAPLSYFLSGEYENEIGFLRMPEIDLARVSAERGGASIPEEQRRPNALRKVGLRANANTAMGRSGDIGVSLGLISSETRLPSSGGVFQSGMWGPGYRTAQDGWLALLSRPGEAFAVRNNEDVTHYISSLVASTQPLGWLSARATVGFDFSSALLDALQRRDEGPLGLARNGQRINSRQDVSQYTADAGASASFAPWQRVTTRTSVGLQYNRLIRGSTTASGTNLAPGSETLAGAAVLTSSEQTIESVVAGSYVEQNVGVAERLFVTAALRADGGSSFGRNFHTALYPKASVSWLAADKREGWLNSIRLRSAYGVSGVQPSSTAPLALITLAPALVDGANVTGARLGATGNPGLKPERQTELEAGVDVDGLHNRLRLEGTYYDRLSRDALIDRPLSSEIGLASRQENIGAVRNRGVEGTVSAVLLTGDRVTWDLSLNGSVNHNRLERIGAGIPFIGTTPNTRSQEGYPLFSRFARPILGYDDANGDGIIEASEIRVGDSLVYMGETSPPRQLSASSGMTLLGGRLRLSTQFDYRGGHTVVNFSEYNRCSTFFSDCRGVNDPTASFAEQARAVASNSVAYGRTFYGYLEDGSFIRWRELAVTYVLPNRLTRQLGGHEAQLTVTGRNLRLFTDYSGVDPEVNSAPGFGEGYSDNPTPPAARYWLLRLNLDF